MCGKFDARWWKLSIGAASCWLTAVLVAFAAAPKAENGQPQTGQSQLPSIIHRVEAPSQRLEMIVHTSRILTLDQRIPQAQVNNPDILDLTPLSPNEIQISAKTPGVTQVNLWGENKKLYTIDVVVYGDAQALSDLLRTHFPNSAIKVIPVANGVMLSGFVDRPEHVELVVRIAEEYYPKVINNLTVGGVQQVLLHVKVMEVSRTKLRRLGFDWAKITGTNVVASGISGLFAPLNVQTGVMRSASSGVPGGGLVGPPGPHTETFVFGVVDGTSAFFGVLEALRQDDLAKVLAEPTLVTISGRPATVNCGGEFPVPVPQSLGTLSIEYKKFGTQLDFVPIVLGNGKIRLDVRPRVSELDRSRAVTIQGTTVPAIRMREAETGVEMQAGQTLAIAGLVYCRTEAQNRGLPWVSEVPYLGALFRKVHEETNEIELLIMVTPELVEPMNASQAPTCGPGSTTTSPSDWELFMKGHLEVPHCCSHCAGAGCPVCNGSGKAIPQLPTPEGMIGPVEEIVPPRPVEGAQNQPRPGRPAPLFAPTVNRPGAAFGAPPPAATASVQPAAAHNRHFPPKPKNPPSVSGARKEPALIGPIGYDIVN
jgi:pilus assembly protein CpaC